MVKGPLAGLASISKPRRARGPLEGLARIAEENRAQANRNAKRTPVPEVPLDLHLPETLAVEESEPQPLGEIVVVKISLSSVPNFPDKCWNGGSWKYPISALQVMIGDEPADMSQGEMRDYSAAVSRGVGSMPGYNHAMVANEKEGTWVVYSRQKKSSSSKFGGHRKLNPWS